MRMVELLEDNAGYPLRYPKYQKRAAKRICDVVGMGWNWMIEYSAPSQPGLEEAANGIAAAVFFVLRWFFCQLRTSSRFASFIQPLFSNKE